MSQVYRNHPVCILRNSLAILVVLIFMAISAMSLWPLAILGVAIVIYIVSWYVATLTVYEDHAVAEFNFISKKKTIIPYGKVASVNAVKTLLGRIFGCTIIQINVNSSQNAARPEISFMLKDAVAAEIIPLLKYGSGIGQAGDVSENGIDGTVPEDVSETVQTVPEEDVPVFEFGFAEAIVFGILGSSTWGLIMSALWTAFSVVSVLTDSAVGIFSILMLVSTGVIPIVGSILKHGNFRVYRRGSTIRVVHGMVTIFDTSFDIEKVNAVCVQRAFFPRLFKRCCLQAEVVGINADAKSTTPNVTLLIRESQLEHAMRSLFPEFVTDYDVPRQPSDAKYPTFSMPTYVSLGFAAFMALAYMILDLAEENPGEYLWAFVALCVAVAVIMYVRAFYALRIRRMGCGDTLFTSVNGILDCSEYTMQYSRVQISDSVASPRCRKHGLVKMHVSLLSSIGGRRITTGFFTKEEAEEIAERTVAMSGHRMEKIDVRNDTGAVLT